MNDLDRLNMAELTKGGQPATAVGTLPPLEQALAQEFAEPNHLRGTLALIADGRGPAKEMAQAAFLTPRDVDEKRIRHALAVERGEVAFDVARSLGYSFEAATRFAAAARSAALMGLARGDQPYAGRVRIGRVLSGLGGSTFVVSILTESGAYYDPTSSLSPANNPGGSD